MFPMFFWPVEICECLWSQKDEAGSRMKCCEDRKKPYEIIRIEGANVCLVMVQYRPPAEAIRPRSAFYRHWL